ncbi:L,D-transpeptidase [Methylobacterium nodulans]|uniref:ErfK/YbiS/YcfS/YnhG family protein n=1 Tax=Methylobacterium nodulans (strain LMG 21967 / CNCM I-2342 / ORS 2060) TaxID=460265 RepID=B8I9I2_METNO|nr:L,D-transpeptidase [Methylobacterium nodulans]ACL55235.1 ErfK/YbiS/YcfS/YnhG family protein [Methylobacterium nodulans ORS 2060]
MRVGVWLAAGVAACATVAEASAQEAGRYGGGFIEFLMTGRDPGSVARPLRPAPVAADGTLIPREQGMAPAYATSLRSGDLVRASPMAAYEPTPPRTRMAALPQGLPEDAAGIGRALDGRYRRQIVPYAGGQKPGTVVIDTTSRFLYLVQPGGQAIRYGIGVGRPGFTWAGIKTITQKREWPDWTPPPEMLRRRPDLPRHMEGGPANPLGARALYLGSSLYRIHGTNEPHTIGQSVSSGCIRMMNEDVIDLYERVPVGATVIVS